MPAQLTKIGKYDVLEVIGRGGMGVVYKATDPHIGRFVAIKMITAGFAGNPDLLKRFYREAQSTGNLQNPNIVTVYDLGDQDGNPYLVMEYLEGESLDSLITSRKPLAMVEKLGIIVDVCNGLSYAHQRGIIHRDIKPANVMVLNDGVAKIVDFGIARIGNSRDTGTGQVIGSVHYMSAEQLRGQPLDFRTDIYSTGVVLFQLLTNELPFDASETGAALLKIIQDPAPPLSSYIKDYPPELESIVARALAKNRDDRYGSAKDLAFDLLRIQEQIKQSSVSEFLRRAGAAIRRSEWGRAKEQLQQALRVDRQHTEAHRLLREVQEKIEKQQKTEHARRLQMSADQAFIERKFDEALGLLQQAITLDPTNLDLRSFLESVQSTKERTAKLEEALRRAEAAQIEGNLEEASAAVAEALALDANDTQAKALKVILSRQLEERARQEEVRQLLDQARNDISARRLTAAFGALHRVEVLDAGSVELQTLMKLAVAARDQELRRAELEKLGQEIQDALSNEDYVAASAKAAAGLQRYPRERELLKLQALAEAQRQRAEQRSFVREQLLAAHRLLDMGKLTDALALLAAAGQRVPDNAEIASLHALIKDRLNAAQAEQRRAQTMQQARDAMAAGEFGKAVQILEKARAEFPRSPDIDDLLTKARAEHVSQRAVSEAQVFATQLIERRELERATQFLESTLREIPDQHLRDLLGEVRYRLEQFRMGVQSAVEHGQRILQEHGAGEAASFLDAQPPDFAAVPKFRDLRQAVRRQQIVEDLDRDLARTPNLERRIALAENLLRKNPGNPAIEERLLAAREKRVLVQSMAQRAHEFERGQEYAQAIECWNSLHEVYPEYPNLDTEITRLQKLEQQRKDLLLRKSREAELRAQKARELEAEKLRQEQINTQNARQAEAQRFREAEAQIAQQAEAERKAREAEAQKAREAEARARKAQEAEAERIREAEVRAARAREAEAQQVREAQARAQKEREAEAERIREAEVRAAKAREAEAQKAREAEARAQKAREAEARKAEANAAKAREAEARKARQAEAEAQKAREVEAQRLRKAEAKAAKARDSIARKARAEEHDRTATFQAAPIPAKSGGDRRIRIAVIAASAGIVIIAAIASLLHWAGAVTVRIETDPSGSQIAINGKTCTSPCTLNLKPGKYAVEARHDGYGTLASDVNIDRSGSLPVLRLQPSVPPAEAHRPPTGLASGTISISTNVEADVLIDGEFKGTTGQGGQLNLSIPAGRHQVRVQKKGWDAVPQSVSLPVSTQSTATVSFRLDPSKTQRTAQSATLIVNSLPGAEVLVDQTLVGRVPVSGELTTTVSPGRHSLDVRSDGYQTWSNSAMFKAGVPLAVMAELTKTPQATPPPSPRAPVATPTATLSATPGTIQQGQAATLTWQTKNATDITIDGGLGAVAASGSHQVSPSQTLTYTLTAKGPGGTSTASFPVVVLAKEAPPPAAPKTEQLSSSDQGEIQRVLENYADAFAKKDLRAVQVLWPGVPREKLNSIKEAFKLNTRLHYVDPKFYKEPGERARVDCTQFADAVVNGRAVQSSGHFSMYLVRRDGHWKIDYIPLNN
ncbi:MAG TPA: protein kinase [Terriglobales bacterium]